MKLLEKALPKEVLPNEAFKRRSFTKIKLLEKLYLLNFFILTFGFTIYIFFHCFVCPEIKCVYYYGSCCAYTKSFVKIFLT